MNKEFLARGKILAPAHCFGFETWEEFTDSVSASSQEEAENVIRTRHGRVKELKVLEIR